ncbi:MAG: K+/H+ antiporter [Actinomycetes bacterium]|nr:MAG: K+/H+ antiporter [Actinomycetes bacterium]
MTDAELILIGGLLLGAGIAAAMIADKVRVPGLVLFLGLGMLVGSEGPGGVEFDDVELTQTLGTIGIVLILFEGGLNAGWPEIRPVLKTAISLAVVGTILTAVIAAAAAAWLFGLGTLESLILGSAIAATDSAAIFSVLRGSSLRRRVARALEGESGLNDPVAVLLVTGFISWLQKPGWGVEEMLLSFAGEIVVGAVVGMLVGLGARWAFVRLDYPTPGLYPVASIAAAALAFGIADIGHGSGLLAVYLTGLTLGTGIVPGQRTVTAFHQGLGWVAQISLFFLLGLLVLPSQLAEVALEGTAFALALIFVARPIATLVATQVERYRLRERIMLSWAGLRGAVPIWLATLPVIAGVQGSGFLFNDIFYVVVISTLLQGFTFEPLARRLGLTTSGAALAQPIVETGTIRELGGDVFAIRIDEGDAAAGRMVKELGLPREALISVIVRDGEAVLPRGSTMIAGGDELHLLIRRELHGEIERLLETWHEGPIPGPPSIAVEMRGSPAIFTVRPTRPEDGDTGAPTALDGIEVVLTLRTRPDVPAAVVALADGRFAVTGPDLVAVGGRHDLSRWCTRRARREAVSPQDRAWLQEAIGSVDAPDLR